MQTRRKTTRDLRERKLVAIISIRDAVESVRINLSKCLGETARVMTYDSYVLGALERTLMGKTVNGTNFDTMFPDMQVPTDIKRQTDADLLAEIGREIDTISCRIPAAEQYEFDVRGSLDAGIYTVTYLPLTDNRLLEMVKNQVSASVDQEGDHIPERLRRMMGVS